MTTRLLSLAILSSAYLPRRIPINLRSVQQPPAVCSATTSFKLMPVSTSVFCFTSNFTCSTSFFSSSLFMLGLISFFSDITSLKAGALTLSSYFLLEKNPKNPLLYLFALGGGLMAGADPPPPHPEDFFL